MKGVDIMENCRVRFAPSPTGPLHIGGARSALFNYLIAKRFKGQFILRIEDTDVERSSRESEDNIFDSLRWLGLDWDEGPDIGGPYGPYRQMERLAIYKKYIQELIDKGLAYYCYCTEEELEEERQELIAKGEPPRYLGKCRELSPEQKEQFIQEGRKPVVRFRVPGNQEIVVNDLVRGKVVFESNGIGDYVILKSDGIPTYNFAVVIDDYLMKISHVIRAEEHLSNTPRQILIYEALGWETPTFAHVSLILGKDKSKMSKRHGATSVVQYKEQGYLPEAVVNFLALLGWAPEGEEEIFTMEELIEQFSLERVSKRPAVFDIDKLKWINGVYIRGCSSEEIMDLIIPVLQEAGYLPEKLSDRDYQWTKLVINGLHEKIHTIKEILDHIDVYVGDQVELESEDLKEVLAEEQVPLVIETLKEKIKAIEELTPETVKTMLKEVSKETKQKGRKVFMPIRIAITGKMHGPELHSIIPALGKENVLKRIEKIVG